MFFKSLIGDLNLAAKAISRTMSKQISSSQALVGCICIKVNMSERENKKLRLLRKVWNISPIAVKGNVL